MSKPLRILHVFGKLNRGGAETMIMTLYRNIDRNKVQFDFVVHTNEKCDYDDEILALGGKIYRVPQYTGKNHFEYKKAWKVFLNEHKYYKILHSHISSTAILYLKEAKKYGMKTIIHSHNISSGKGIDNKFKDFLQIPLKKEKKADFRFACSKDAGKWLFDKCDFKVINNAIDTNMFIFNEDKRNNIRKLYSIEDKLVIGNIARFSEQKNHIFLIDIFNEIYKKNKNAVLMLVGDGHLKNEIEDKVNLLGLRENVIFTGVKSNVNEHLMAMDVFLFPSLFEGLGIVLIEAQASGLKCFTSDIVVPNEAKVSDLLEYINLSKDAKYWAGKVLECDNGYERENMTQYIVDMGYDIKETVKYLQSFYLNL